jgi:hypothetical protein
MVRVAWRFPHRFTDLFFFLTEDKFEIMKV